MRGGCEERPRVAEHRQPLGGNVWGGRFRKACRYQARELAGVVMPGRAREGLRGRMT